MFKITQIDDFNIFEPSEKAAAQSKPSVDLSLIRNKEFLKNFTTPQQKKMVVSGSFIYAHPPDYKGCPALNWNSETWTELFTEMKQAGLDTVIFLASIWHELGEAYYKSDYFKNIYKTYPVIEAMLPAAKKIGLHVYLGGYGCTIGWSKCIDKKTVNAEVNRQLHCVKELFEYRDLFEGVYFTPETAVSTNRDIEREKSLNELYRRYFSELKSLSPQHKILMSPATKHGNANGEIIVDGWLNVLNRVPLDIMAPQDSIGCAGCNLSIQQAAWEVWKKICDNSGIELWANAELFERHGFGGPAPFHPADPERVIAQINNVSGFVKKIICWEYPYFAGTKGAARSELIRERIFNQ